MQMGGATLADDGSTMTGSFMIMMADSKEEVRLLSWSPQLSNFRPGPKDMVSSRPPF